MTEDSNSRRVAILWFVAAALSLAAAILRWGKDGEMVWAPVAAALFMTILGITRLRLPKAGGPTEKRERKR